MGEPHAAWRPGESGNPAGRPKGARSKLSERFLAALLADFLEHGLATIEHVRRERPHEYLKLIVAVLPKLISATDGDRFDDMSDDELIAAIRFLDEATPLLEAA